MFVQIMLRVIDSQKNLILIIVKIVSNFDDEFNFKILYVLHINIYNIMLHFICTWQSFLCRAVMLALPLVSKLSTVGDYDHTRAFLTMKQIPHGIKW